MQGHIQATFYYPPTLAIAQDIYQSLTKVQAPTPISEGGLAPPSSVLAQSSDTPPSIPTAPEVTLATDWMTVQAIGGDSTILGPGFDDDENQGGFDLNSDLESDEDEDEEMEDLGAIQVGPWGYTLNMSSLK